ncbi:glutathione S-transferase N-terminal domain-containing protein [Pseudohalocynthiibacter aestuariivivens]|jgi:Glutathione S-transferase, N-terminal domain|nr:glutathione S-transferase N-terminal domain-containing protein [Pseudohalocynthiibacter aestuariivivens]MBS9718860.1 glutathione S-transferase N-terminal domain-containing protein [Pseudohalocynthiibacter aestuariivivens]
MLTVWGRRTSSNVQALMWCIGELGLTSERHDAGHKYGGTDTDDFFDLNPNRTIPVLQDGTNPPLWETGCILRYLASRYADEWSEKFIKLCRWARSGNCVAGLSSCFPCEPPMGPTGNKGCQIKQGDGGQQPSYAIDAKFDHSVRSPVVGVSSSRVVGFRWKVTRENSTPHSL